MWRKITKEDVTGEGRPEMLVTNNINARDAYGNMSHVWIGRIQESSYPERDGKYVCFTSGYDKIQSLTYCCEIPQP